MPLTKVCEQCSTSVNVKKSVCVCGHTFAKSHVTRQSKRIAMKRKRAVESELETAARQGKDRDTKAHKRALEDDIQHSYRNKRDRTYTAKTRANETQQQTMCRQELNRACTAKTRANETQQQAMCRQEHDRACTAKARASETQQQTMCRQELNRACTAKTRANETQQQAMCRQEHDRACTAKARASETQQQTMCRQEHDRTYTAKKRALQSPKDTLLRKQSNRTAMAKKRNADMSLAMAIDNFQSLTKLGPEFVCTCCHRMMYKQSVVSCNPTKYAKIEPAMQALDRNFSCMNCKKTVEPKNDSIGTCTSCNTQQKLTHAKVSAKIFIQSNKDTPIAVRANAAALLGITGKDPALITAEDILFAPTFTVTYNKFHLITNITRE